MSSLAPSFPPRHNLPAFFLLRPHEQDYRDHVRISSTLQSSSIPNSYLSSFTGRVPFQRRRTGTFLGRISSRSLVYSSSNRYLSRHPIVLLDISVILLFTFLILIFQSATFLDQTRRGNGDESNERSTISSPDSSPALSQLLILQILTKRLPTTQSSHNSNPKHPPASLERSSLLLLSHNHHLRLSPSLASR